MPKSRNLCTNQQGKRTGHQRKRNNKTPRLYKQSGAQGTDTISIMGHFPISTTFTSAAGKVVTIAPTISNCG